MDDLGQFVQDMMQHWEAPGLAVALVHDGALVMVDGFGLRDREQ